MTIVIEDGTIVSGSNSYITAAEFTSYASDVGYVATGDIDPFLIRSFRFMGALPWCVSHDSAYTVTDGIKNAQAEMAYRIYKGFDIGDDVREVQSETVTSDLNVTYFKSQGSPADPMVILSRMPMAKMLLKGLLCPGMKYLLRA